MTKTMLEKVARAIWEARMETHGRWPDDGPLDAQTEQVRDWVMDEARAALEAMRELTERMTDAGAMVHLAMHEPYDTREQICNAIFTAMIDAALAQPPEPQ